MIKDIATKEGAVIDLPDNFYSQIADMHSESKKEVVVDKTAVYTDRVSGHFRQRRNCIMISPGTPSLRRWSSTSLTDVPRSLIKLFSILKVAASRQIPAVLSGRKVWHGSTMS